MTAEIYTLYKANKALSKRQRAKKTHICQGGALEVQEACDIIA